MSTESPTELNIPQQPKLRISSNVLRDRWIGVAIGNKYHVEEKIGTGSMAVVYRARHLQTNRPVAIKKLRAPNPELSERFRREGETVSRLKCANTVQIFEIGMHQRTPWMAMELLQGHSLEEEIDKGPMDPARTLWVLSQVCNALEEAHALGIIHRDIKPANIFIDRSTGQDVVKVLDFGIAKLTGGSGADMRSLTMVGAVMGTPTYMSPEQADGQTIDARADLYGLGAVAYHALAKKPPFEGLPGDVIFQHINKAPKPFDDVQPPVPIVDRRVEDLIMQCLAKKPTGRPSSAQALRYKSEELIRLLTAPPAPPRRSVWKAASVVMAVLGVVAAGGLMFWKFGL